MPVGERFSAPVQTSLGAHPASCAMGTGSFPRVKSGRGVTLTPHSLLVPLVMKVWSYTSTPPTGRTACTEPECLYKGALYLYFYFTERNRSKHTWKTATGPHLGKIQITLSKHIWLKSVLITFCSLTALTGCTLQHRQCVYYEVWSEFWYITLLNKFWYITLFNKFWYITLFNKFWYITLFNKFWYVTLFNKFWYITLFNKFWMTECYG